MEQLSISYTATKSVDYLGQSHKWSDSDAISSYKEICKQLDVCQEKLREECEQKAHRNLKKSSSYSELSAQQVSSQSKQRREEFALRAEEKRLIRVKNALWRLMGPSSPKILKW